MDHRLYFVTLEVNHHLECVLIEYIRYVVLYFFIIIIVIILVIHRELVDMPVITSLSHSLTPVQEVIPKYPFEMDIHLYEDAPLIRRPYGSELTPLHSYIDMVYHSFLFSY